MESIVEKLRLIQPIFEAYPELTDSNKTMLAENSYEMVFQSGETIFKEAGITSNVYFLIDGLIKLTREHKNNKTIILGVVPSNRFIGLVSLLGGPVYDISAKAIKRCEIVTFHENIFKRIMQSNSNFAYAITQKLSSEGLSIVNHLININQKQLPGRVADIILFFAALNKSSIFELPITRRELAEFAGTSKESFIRTLSEFKADKIVSFDDKRTIIINSMEILQKLSKYG